MKIHIVIFSFFLNCGLNVRKCIVLAVDGFVRCEKWMRSDIIDSRETKTTSWFKRFIGREQKPEVAWPFPFQEGRLFILTLRAGLEGYHVNVGGRHVSSFHYRPVCLSVMKKLYSYKGTFSLLLRLPLLAI